MEITIDFELIRRIIREDARQAGEDVRVSGPLSALLNSQLRHDQRLQSACDASSLACVEGCAYCCHFRVDVRAAEVFAILDFMHEHFELQRRDELMQEIRSRAALIGSIGEAQHHTTNIPCAFLKDGRCAIYPVRPQTCRNYHATRVEGCKATFDDPNDSDIDPDYAPLVYQSGGAHVDAVSSAFKSAGYCVSVYEMNSALASASTDMPSARRRFENGFDPFPDLNGFEPPAEFLDLVE